MIYPWSTLDRYRICMYVVCLCVCERERERMKKNLRYMYLGYAVPSAFMIHLEERERVREVSECV